MTRGRGGRLLACSSVVVAVAVVCARRGMCTVLIPAAVCVSLAFAYAYTCDTHCALRICCYLSFMRMSYAARKDHWRSIALDKNISKKILQFHSLQ